MVRVRVRVVDNVGLLLTIKKKQGKIYVTNFRLFILKLLFYSLIGKISIKTVYMIQHFGILADRNPPNIPSKYVL